MSVHLFAVCLSIPCSNLCLPLFSSHNWDYARHSKINYYILWKSITVLKKMDSLEPPAEEMLGSVSITSPLPQAVLRCLSVCARCPASISPLSSLSLPSGKWVSQVGLYFLGRIRFMAVGKWKDHHNAAYKRIFFCHLKSSMNVRKPVVKSFCVVPSYVCCGYNEPNVDSRY